MMLLRRLTTALLLLLLAGPAWAQTVGTLAPVARQQFFDSNGNPLAGGLLHTYAAGTTTNQATYPDATLSPGTQLTNPIQLDSAGRATYFLSPTSYRFRLETSAGVLVWDIDNIAAVAGFVNLDIPGTAGENLSLGDFAYLSAGDGGLTLGKWYKTSSTNAYSSSIAAVVGGVPAAITVGNAGTIRIAGRHTMAAATLTAGSTYYLDTGAGTVTASAPAQRRMVGRADSASTLVFGNESQVIEETITLRNVTTGNVSSTAHGFAPIGMTAAPLSECEGRITLTAGVPVTSADVTAATSVKWSPYKGNRCPLYDGTNWQMLTFAELSLALGTDTTDKNYDLFGFISTGAWAIERLVWTNDTTRATTLTLQDGVWTKTGDATRRWLGAYRTTGAGQTEDSAAKRFVYNYYNQKVRHLKVLESGNYNYTLAAYRQAHALATNQVAVLVGLAENMIEVNVAVSASNTNTSVSATVTIGEDSTTVGANEALNTQQASTIANVLFGATATLRKMPAVGYHFYAWLEFSTAVGTTTWFGSAGGPGIQSGITGSFAN